VPGRALRSTPSSARTSPNALTRPSTEMADSAACGSDAAAGAAREDRHERAGVVGMGRTLSGV
jgi:hypothetical protein